MKKEQNRSSQFIIIICILILIIAVIGVSYAAIFYSRSGEKVNNITTGTMTMSYSENNNGINLVDAYPTTDATGMVLSQPGEYFDFTVSASLGGTSSIKYIITGVKDESSTLPDSAVKVYLTELKNGETQVLAPTKLSDLNKTTGESYGAPLGQFVLAVRNFTSSDIHNYRLRMWVANDYTLENYVQTYKLRVNVYGNSSV